MSNDQDKAINVHTQNKDIIFKTLTDIFPYILLMLLKISFGPNTKFVQVPSELASVESYHGLPDKVFLADDCKIVVLEFDSSGDPTNLTRYMSYAARLSAKYTSMSQGKVFHPVYFYVIYPANVNIPPCDYTTEGNLLFSVKPVSIGKLFNDDDSDEFLATMSQKLASDPNYIPSDEDFIHLVLSIFGRAKKNRKTFFRKVANLSNSLFYKPGQEIQLGVIAGALIKFFKANELSSLLGLGGSEMEELINLLSEGKFSFFKSKYVELNAAKDAAELKVAELEVKAAKEAKVREAAERKAAKEANHRKAAELKVAELEAKVAELEGMKKEAELKD
jgi:hypothetical protein